MREGNVKSSTRWNAAYSPVGRRLQEGEDCSLAVADSQPGVVDCWPAEVHLTLAEADCSLGAAMEGHNEGGQRQKQHKMERRILTGGKEAGGGGGLLAGGGGLTAGGGGPLAGGGGLNAGGGGLLAGSCNARSR